jgi:hypothetical protein
LLDVILTPSNNAFANLDWFWEFSGRNATIDFTAAKACDAFDFGTAKKGVH